MLHQGVLFYLHETPLLCADGVHHLLALTSASHGQYASHVAFSAQRDDICHLRQFGIRQGSHGIQAFSGGTN